MSTSLRQQIGRRRKALANRISEVEEDLPAVTEVKDYTEDKDIIDILSDCAELHEQISTEIQKIRQYSDQWQEIIRQDPKEEDVKKVYTNTHGDFEEDVKKGEKALITIKQVYDAALAHFNTRFPSSTIEIPLLVEQVKQENGMSREEIQPQSTIPNVFNNGFINAPQPIVEQWTDPPRTNPAIPTQHWNNHPVWPIQSFTSTLLPRAELPKFDGDELKFAEFKLRFDSIIGRQAMDEIMKMDYLKMCVVGTAEKIVRCLPSTAPNYLLAWTMLEEHFGGDQRLRHSLLCKIQDLPPIRNSTSGIELFEFWSTAAMLFNQLVLTGENVDHSSLAIVLERKLPDRILHRLYQNSDMKIYKMSELLQAINVEARKEMRIQGMKDDNKSTSPKITTMATSTHRPPQGQNTQHQQHQRPPGQHQNQAPKEPKSPCLFCATNSNHRYSDCPTFNTAEKRKARAIALKICFGCLKNDHIYRDCPRTTRKCFCCKKEHKIHSCLCDRKPSAHPTATGQSNPSTNVQSRPANRNQVSTHVAIADNSEVANANPVTMIVVNHHSNNTPQRTNVNHESNNSDEMSDNHPDTRTNEGDADCEEIVRSIVKASTPIPPNRPWNQSKPVCMMAKQVKVIDKNGKPILANLFIDNGSNRSYLSTELANKLDLIPEEEETLQVQTFGSSSQQSIKSYVYSVKLQVNDKEFDIRLSQAPLIATSITAAAPNQRFIDELLHDQSVEVDRIQVTPDILLGLDTSDVILGEISSKILPNGFCLYSTNIGPILCGTEKLGKEEVKIEDDDFKNSYFTKTASAKGILSCDPQSEHEQLHDSLQRFWKLEAFGIDENLLDDENERASKFFHDTIRRDELGRYIVRLPYSDDPKQLATNRNQAYCILMSNLKKLRTTNVGLIEKYNSIIQDQIRRGFIERVDENDSPTGKIVLYLPHHGVQKESTSTDLRIVYNGSFKSSKEQHSLNSVLHTGESLLPNLNGIIMRSRRNKILISSDLEKAFLQMSLHEEDRDATRFLWVDDWKSLNPKVIAYRFCRVPFGVKSSPYLLNATVSLHLKNSNDEYADATLENIYVDNSFYGTNSIEDGKRYYRHSKKEFQSCQMNMRQFTSNSEELNQYFSTMEGTPPESENQKILGVKWNTQSDKIMIQQPKPLTGLLTKRLVLKNTSQIFDPMGHQAPVTLLGKVFFQKLWTTTKSWDEPLNKIQEEEWYEVLRKWHSEPIQLDRQYFKDADEKDVYELHVYSDASKLAYGAVGYLRRIGNNTSEARIIMAKSRLAPLKKKLSIPELEMCALVVAAELKEFIEKELHMNLESSTIWSDSQCSIDALKANKGSVFIKNRIRKFKEKSGGCAVRHVAGSENPADILSRGSSMKELAENNLWWNGPNILSDGNMKFEKPQKDDDADDNEKKENIADQEFPDVTQLFPGDVVNVAISKTKKQCDNEQEHIIDPHRFSTFHRFIRTLMVIFHFFARMKGHRNDYSQKARKTAFKIAQIINPIPETTKNVMRLVNTDGLWRYSGRIAENPVILLPVGKIAELYVQEVHERNHHSSVNFTLAECRKSVWIPKGRQFIRKVINKCIQCQKQNSKHYHQPEFPMFPNKRTKAYSPFTYCGIDFAGPVQVLDDKKCVKIWMIIFTCISSRYIHVEMASDMTAATLLLAIRRLAAIYGIPKWINSDNGAQLTAIKELFKQLKGHSSFINSTTLPIFHTNPAESPWSGGHFERLIGILKQSLVKAGTTTKLLSTEEFRTLLAESCNIVNRRPLTYSTMEDTLLPLRPVDLVIPHINSSDLLLADENWDESELRSTQAQLLAQWRDLSTLSTSFRTRWELEYPQLLRERLQFGHHQQSSTFKPKLGDVVLLEDERRQKLAWPIGRIVEVGSNSLKVKRADTGRVVERPLLKVYMRCIK